MPEQRTRPAGWLSDLGPGSLATVVMLAAAMPGRLGWWPLLFVALTPLLHITSRHDPFRSAAAGLLTGFLYHVCLLYWIVIVLGRYGGLPPWISVPALLLLALYMGSYMGLFAGLLAFHRVRSGGAWTPGMIFLAPALWVGLEWLRGVLFSGFPWMDLGYGLAPVPLLIQAADLGGHHLITFCLVLANVLLAHGCIMIRFPRRQWRSSLLAVAAGVLILLVVGGYSLVRQAGMRQALAEAPRIRIGVVQGNIAQDEKWTPALKSATLDTYLRLSGSLVKEERPALLVWPETAIPFYPAADSLFAEVTEMAERHSVWLLAGAPYYTLGGATDAVNIAYFNSALLIGPDGEPAGRYDKQHLVPFGEYVPLRRFLPFLEPLVESVGSFTPGRSAAPLVADLMKLGTLICYESIFPGLACGTVAGGANVLVNMTNDAWYGRSSAPHQSFAMTVFRAVETRRSLVRAANTGISGFVSPLGRVVRQSGLFEPAAFAADLPLYEGRTVFVLAGRFFGPACLAFVPLLAALRRRGSRTFRSSGKKVLLP